MKKVFFIGICGISMSALAVLLKEQGNYVCGMDKNYSNPPQSLKKSAIKVLNEQAYKLVKNFDLIVYSSAIKDDDKALEYAKKLGKICVSRGELLGEISNGFEKTIAVAGSHGKSTTTAMIYHCLKVAGKNPTLHLGAVLKKEKTNVVLGEKEYFVTEACEYHDNFLYLTPYVGVVTNIEKEHMDYFKTFEREKKSFEKFKNNSIYVVDTLLLSAKNIKTNKCYGVSFYVYDKEKKLCKINLKIGGFYNVSNAVFAMQTCLNLGLSLNQIKIGLETFCGIQKRLDFIDFFDKKIIVDYAHHPTEIENVLMYLKKLKKKVKLIFQPHTYSRTKNLLKDFLRVLSKADELYIYKTYEAREKKKDGLSAEQLTKKIVESGKKCKYLNKEDEVKKVLSQEGENYLCVVMGAGDLPEKLGLI